MALTIAYTIPGKQDGASELLLCGASDVAADHGQAHAKSQSLEKAEPQSDKTAPFVAARQSNKKSSTNYAYGVGCHHCETADTRPTRANEAASQKRNKLNRTSGNLQVLRSESTEAEGINDDGGKGRNGRVGHLSTNGHDEEDPGLGISECLPHLVRLEVTVLNTLSVGRDSLYCDDPFTLVQKLGCGRQIRQDQQRYYAPSNTA